MPGFVEVPRDVVVDLAARVAQRRANAGTPIVEQGRASPTLVFLVRGAAKIVRVVEEAGASHAVVVGVLRGPTLVPDASVADARPAGSSVVALRSSQIFCVDRAMVRVGHPSIARAVAARFAHEMRAQERRLAELVVGPVESRIRRLLDGLALEHGTALGTGRFIAIPLRRRDIASMVNATTETVSRLLARLEREGDARTTRDGIWWRTTPRESGVRLVADAPSAPAPARAGSRAGARAGSRDGSRDDPRDG